MSYDVSFKFKPFSYDKYFHSFALSIEVLRSFDGTFSYFVCAIFHDCPVPARVSPFFDNAEAAFDFADFLTTKYPDLKTDDYPFYNFDSYPFFDKKLMEVNSDENK